MLLGPQHTGFASISCRRIGVYESQLGVGDNGNADAGVILSKTSIPLEDCADAGELEDLFPAGISADFARYNSLSSYGEPATPHGTGDYIVSVSPVSSRPRHSYACGGPSLADTDEPSNGFSLSRHSYNDQRQQGSLCQSFEAPHSTPISGTWPWSAAQTFGAGFAAKAANDWATAPLLDSSALQPIDADARAHFFERQLLGKCLENKALLRLLRERDEELCVLRTELDHLRAQSSAEQRPTAAGVQPDLLTHLQCSKEEMYAHEQSFFVSSAYSGVLASLLSTSPLAPHVQSRPVVNVRDQPATPPRPNTLQTPGAISTMTCLVSEPQPLLEPNSPLSFQTAPVPVDTLPPPELPSDVNTIPAEAAPATQTIPANSAAASSNPSPDLVRSLLGGERRRTDRAHSALLFSSRQAQGLAEELAEERARAAALHEELRDWRRACLNNHKLLARLRREGVRVVEDAGAGVAGEGNGRSSV